MVDTSIAGTIDLVLLRTRRPFPAVTGRRFSSHILYFDLLFSISGGIPLFGDWCVSADLLSELQHAYNWLLIII
ncbi:hypothetical protein P8452_45281 [Trifolium repens]|nr:hypothetical protein P8452_45281 [Trifolium repens]